MLVPSLADLLFASLLAWLFASGSGWIGLLADGDTGWHIRTGEYILAQGSVPRYDLFSFSRAGQPWFAWEWLSDVVFAVLHRHFGLAGVAAFAGVLVAMTVMLMFRQMLWRGANALVALAITLLSAGASSIHYLARPHVFSLFFLAASLWMVDRDRRSCDGMIWLLVPLTAVWVNLHGGFLALLACLGLLTAGSAAEAWLEHSEVQGKAARRYAVLCALCGAASLANPYGIRLHLHIARYLRSDWIREAVDEFQSPRFRSENILQFEILLLAGLLLAGILVSRKRISDALPVLAWAHMALGAVRHVPVFALVASPLIAVELSRYWDRMTVAGSPRSLAAILNTVARDAGSGFGRMSVWAPLLAAGVLVVTPASHWPRDFPEVKFPVKLVLSHGRRLEGERVFTSDQWADYLIYRGWPRQRVFIDGRSDFYGPTLGKEYLAVMGGLPEWEKVLSRHDFAAALIPPDWPLAALLGRHPGWRLAARDSRAMLFVRVPALPEAGTKESARAAR